MVMSAFVLFFIGFIWIIYFLNKYLLYHGYIHTHAVALIHVCVRVYVSEYFISTFGSRQVLFLTEKLSISERIININPVEREMFLRMYTTFLCAVVLG